MPWANVNETSLHYEMTGPEMGTPIVFIPPPLLTLEAFKYQKEQLSVYFRVITFDIRGHGGSAPSKMPLRYELISQDIVGLLDFLGIEQAFLCGYSTGGTVALAALLAYSSRFVGGIIVSGMSELTDTYNRIRVWLAIRMANPSRVMNLLTNAITYGNADKQTTYQELNEHALHDAAANVKSYFEQSFHYSCTTRLHSIHQPVLLIYGQKDRGFHPYAHILHEGLPNSSLFFIKGAKHPVPIQSAGRMNDIIHLWIESLDKKEQKERWKLDLAIAQKLHPQMYGTEEDAENGFENYH
ncbi:pimeloyl-ACP methyl ester carboxylesterase [Paenibacillus qinlingensis]|uniref:Pimeloyl-ACP methyl ester carboxylesterase n=1 Tax=Paenibacillus qinlingensis TaxID=1837343 RepID=A0ABU1P5A8_9BACL|nr:pimeloyl-ACP methyl ester carboxylesterase [Paenibacillus qinlingensis]